MRFQREFLWRVLQEAGGPAHILGLKAKGEHEIFILYLERNEHWYHLTHQGRYIHFPQQQLAQDFIATLESYIQNEVLQKCGKANVRNKSESGHRMKSL